MTLSSKLKTPLWLTAELRLFLVLIDKVNPFPFLLSNFAHLSPISLKCLSSLGYLSYRFKLMPTPPQTSQKQLKVNTLHFYDSRFSNGCLSLSSQTSQICIDVDHAKCGICLSVWHDVVTIAPCFHNFWCALQLQLLLFYSFIYLFIFTTNISIIIIYILIRTTATDVSQNG